MSLPRLGAGDATVVGRPGEVRGTVDLGVLGITEGKGLPAFLTSTDRMLALDVGERLPGSLPEFIRWADKVHEGLGDHLFRAAVDADSLCYLLVRAPNGCVGAVTAPPAAWIRGRQRRGFLGRMVRDNPGRVGIVRLRGTPVDMRHVIGRNLRGRATLAARRIVLVGCGTIGGLLAKFLAQSGAGMEGGRLDVVDEDIYAAGNVGRHWLPPRYVGSAKSSACVAELGAMFPGASIRGHVADIMTRLDLLRDAELVIDATGEEAVSFAINDEVTAPRRGATASLHVWLTGAGAAAQVLFVPAVRDGRGCFRCLRPGPGSFATAEVMLPGAGDGVVPAACGEAAHTPYGVAAPAIAAGLAVRLAVEWAAGSVSPTLRTVRVDHAATRPVEDADLPADPSCPACGSR